MACRPFVRAMQINVEHLCTFEGIAFGKTDHHFRAYAVGSLSLRIGFYIKILRFVKHKIIVDVERITA